MTAARILPCFVLLLSLLAVAQPTPRRQAENKSSAATEHYEGSATNNEQESIPVTIDLAESAGAFSGQIISSYGTFAITGGTRDGDSVTLHFDVNGDTGTITARLADGHLAGTYTAGNQSGSVDVQKTPLVPPPPSPTPILILGVFHMDALGSNQDKSKSSNDMLGPKRQEEIQELIEDLAHFRPTKIAIEAPYGDTFWPDQYRKYLAGQYKLGRNEIDQIAFRLAKRLNLVALYGVDAPSPHPGTASSEMQVPNPKTLDENAKQGRMSSAEEALLGQSTVIQYLSHLNSPAEIRRSQETYMMRLLPSDGTEPDKQTDQVADWYKQNLRIFSNINRITDRGKDRILVIIDAQHVKLLRDFAADAPYYDLADPESLLN
ncbi:MAG TPA: DUF5694 domain-containing protein [Candidatus Sulfotelmatobacter sp.]|nr:DUF5694 domain-containing protein [Candidatus Sulfotelmatobacter sp.]